MLVLDWIVQLIHSIKQSLINNKLKYTTFGKTHACKVKAGMFYAALYILNTNVPLLRPYKRAWWRKTIVCTQHKNIWTSFTSVWNMRADRTPSSAVIALVDRILLLGGELLPGAGRAVGHWLQMVV